MPQKKYYNPQDDVIKIVDGKRVPVQAYDMYKAMHEDPMDSVKSARAEKTKQAAQTKITTEQPPANNQTEGGNHQMPDTYFKFDGQNMTLVENKDGQVKEHALSAVSGRPNRDGTFSYNEQRQRIKNVGPIPEGQHTIDLNSIEYIKDQSAVNRLAGAITPTAHKANTLLKKYLGPAIPPVRLSYTKILGHFPGDKKAWGEGRVDIRLDPNIAMETKRSGITAHGGWDPGSAGCIDLVNNDKEFFNELERLKKKQKEVPLVVDYSQTPDKVRWPEKKKKFFGLL